MDIRVSNVPNLKFGMALIVSADAPMVKYGLIITAYALTIINGMDIIVFLALEEKYGIH